MEIISYAAKPTYKGIPAVPQGVQRPPNVSTLSEYKKWRALILDNNLDCHHGRGNAYLLTRGEITQNSWHTHADKTVDNLFKAA